MTMQAATSARFEVKHEDSTNDKIHMPALFSGKRKRTQLPAGCSHHHEKRTLLHSGQGRIQRTGSGYDTRSVLHRFHLFIEPMSVVKTKIMNIRELELEEQKAIEVIIFHPEPAGCCTNSTYPRRSFHHGTAGFYFARAKLAMDMNATEPIFNDEGRIRLKNRHATLSLIRRKLFPLISV